MRALSCWGPSALHRDAPAVVTVLVGSLETSQINFLYNRQPLPCATNSNSIAQAVGDGVEFLGINKNAFCLLLSDAAKYMVAGGILKPLYL